MASNLKNYIVTVTSKFPAYNETAGSFEIVAATAAEAVKKARTLMRHNGHDRHDGPVSYRASRA